MAVLAALASPPAASWAVAFHLADDHHGGPQPRHDEIAALERALHGHSHEKGTAPHGHPVLTSCAAQASARPLLSIAATLGDVPLLPTPGGGLRGLPPSGPTHDPPPRPASKPILRI